MSKAKDLAMGLFPLLETDKIGNNPYISYNTEQLAKQEGFIRGYHQAEKDSELTWEDIQLIVSIDWDLDHEGFSCGKSTEEYYKEVLKQFNEERKK